MRRTSVDPRLQLLRGFYAIVDRYDEALVHALLAHASVVQLRLKPPVPVSTRELLATARWLRAASRQQRALLVINDRLDIALAVEADAVHLGQTDLPAEVARRVAASAGRPDLLIGVSTHNRAQVRQAVADGADYLGYGPVFVTATKANPDPVQGVEALAAAVAAAGATPVVAIGGVTAETVAAVRDAGAAAACCVAAVNGAADPALAAQQFRAAWAG